MDVLNALTELAKNHRLARVEYRRAGQSAVTPRLVEPYAIEGVGVDRVLRCRQIDPPAVGDDAWKSLRLDRIVRVSDGGQAFQPQTAVTLGQPQAANPFSDAHRIATEPGEEYRQYVLSCLLDGKLSPAEIQGAARFTADLPDDRRRAIHARVFATALGEAAMDGSVTEQETDYLARLHTFLRTLGWAP